jgi:hypothetical protein
MELDGSNVVEVARESEEATPDLVAPKFDLVVIPSRHKYGLARVKLYPSNRTIMLRKTVDESAHSVVP